MVARAASPFHQVDAQSDQPSAGTLVTSSLPSGARSVPAASTDTSPLAGNSPSTSHTFQVAAPAAPLHTSTTNPSVSTSLQTPARLPITALDPPTPPLPTTSAARRSPETALRGQHLRPSLGLAGPPPPSPPTALPGALSPVPSEEPTFLGHLPLAGAAGSGSSGFGIGSPMPSRGTVRRVVARRSSAASAVPAGAAHTSQGQTANGARGSRASLGSGDAGGVGKGMVRVPTAERLQAPLASGLRLGISVVPCRFEAHVGGARGGLAGSPRR